MGIVMRDPNIRSGLPAPGFTLASTGGQVSLSEYHDRNVLLYFMGDFTCSRGWSGVARLSQLRRTLRITNMAVLLIGRGRYLEPAARLAASFFLPAIVLNDVDGRVSGQYGLPDANHSATILIDRQGSIRYYRQAKRPQVAIEVTDLTWAIKSAFAEHTPHRFSFRNDRYLPCLKCGPVVV